VFATQADEQDKKNFEDLGNIYGFITENKYVIEAIFENVLLENQMYHFPLSNLNQSEKKILMEKLLANEEFKEYIFQKIIKGEEETPEPAAPEGSVEKKLQASDVQTHDGAD
jgi:hypothetical protein